MHSVGVPPSANSVNKAARQKDNAYRQTVYICDYNNEAVLIFKTGSASSSHCGIYHLLNTCLLSASFSVCLLSTSLTGSACSDTQMSSGYCEDTQVLLAFQHRNGDQKRHKGADLYNKYG